MFLLMQRIPPQHMKWQSPLTVFGFIFYIWFTYTFFIELEYPGVYWKAVFQYAIIMTVLSLYQTATVAPGFAAQNIDSPHTSIVITPDTPKTPPQTPEPPRFCDICKLFKPPRSHHCSKCKRCVLRRDHHCPWAGGCIGEYNYKYYVLLLLHGSSAGLNVFFVLFWPFVETIWEDDFLDKEWRVIFLYIINGLLLGSCMYLLYFHLNIIFANMTTMEWFTARADEEFRNRYDKGLFPNFIEVFGTDPLFWFLPFSPKEE